MGGDPASCCKAIQETRRVDLSDGRRTGGHDDLWTHKREPDGRPDPKIFSVCERRTADDRWDRVVFRKIKRDHGIPAKFIIKFQTGKKDPATGTYPRIPVRALFHELQFMIPDWILQEVHKCRNNKCIEEIDEQTSY